MTKIGNSGKPRGGGDAVAYQRGLAAFETGKYEDAIDLLTPIADVRGVSSTLARFYLGQAHLRLGIEELGYGRNASALKHLTIARQLNPESAELSKYLAACFARRGQLEQAIVELERDQSAEQADRERPIRVAHAFARDGQLERAVETLVKIIDAEPHRIDVRVQLGLLYGAAERFEDSLCIFSEAAELAPFDADVRFRLGMALAAAGDHSEAVENIAVAQRLRPNDATIALMLAMAVDAAKTTSIKVAVNPVIGKLGVVDDHSLDTLGELIAREPEFVEAFLSLPPSDIDAEVFAMIAMTLERALEHQPAYADLYFHCSRIYDRLGRTRDAIARADQAIEINPRYVQALIHLARMFAKGDQTDEAIERLQSAIDFGGDYPDVHHLLGELYRRRGQTEDARREFLRALELNTNFKAARESLATVGG